MKPEDNPSIYLASKSPRRRELLQQIGVSHQVINADVTEVPRTHESPSEYVQRLAREKAEAGFASVKRLQLAVKPVLGADTIVVINNEILEKPQDAEHAAVMLRKLAGADHQVMTAVAMIVEEKCSIKLSVTDVVFRPLGDDEIAAYWKTGEPCDKAGGYAIQGLGAVFVQQIRGSYTGVVGLPIEQTVALLDEFAVPYWQSSI
ncbi:Maf-like protein [Cellvibrio zantedeschiae]|uniref:dTTP/UTP pyrophosphatase n=1 Tax=Cellvibrio zantedeschiae TaxID=1237077 RepID=A0ABQ3AQS1_9GAMM|nr:Maf family protein [Cellvibrio zantedeschiae]GGY63836.1 Maf-like protein [Cellvibrio zantedeschiae]